MADSEFYKEAVAAFKAGPEAFCRWLDENVAEEGHTHAIDDVEGLTEALEGDPEDDEDDEGTG